jgi:hypothetical protein
LGTEVLVSFEYALNIGVVGRWQIGQTCSKKYKGYWTSCPEWRLVYAKGIPKTVGVRWFFFMECFFLPSKRNIPGVRGRALHKKSRPQAR